MVLDEEISKIKTGVMKADCVNLILGLAGPTTALERVATLLSWLRPHLTKQGSISYTKEHNAILDTKILKGCLQPGLAGKLKIRTGSVTT